MEAVKAAGKRPQTKYNAAFRSEAVRRVNQNGQMAARVAQALGMSEAVLSKWVRAGGAQAARPGHCWPARQQCQRLGVRPSGYYAWCKRAPASAAEQALPLWQVAAQRVFSTHAGRYGQRRLRAQLRREGHEVGRQRLRRCLSTSGLRALSQRTSTRPPRTTQADLHAVAAVNKLDTWPAATAPNQIWVGDITYLALAMG